MEVGLYDTSMVSGTSNMKNAVNSRVLNFSGSSMTTSDCKQLCKNIVNSNCLDTIRFHDCLLPEDIAKSIINALACCKSIKVVDFTGNNFRANDAEHLCKLLKQTTTLKELYLGCNSLGLYEKSIAAIAEDLAVNKSVEILDLSNNQISHSGGKLISVALKRNKTLTSLDLRWNNIGVAGGREVLSALQHNKSLINLQLDGNNILCDTLNAISSSIQHNIDHHKLKELKSKLDHVSNEKEMMTEISTQRENEMKCASMKINTLEKNLFGLSKIHSELQSAHLEELKTLDERMRNERKKWEIEMVAKEQKYQREKGRFKREYEEQVKSLTDKVMKHLYDKEQLEEEITKLKTSIMNNKLMFDEELANQRTRGMQEDAFKSKQYEERIDFLLASKDELQCKISRLLIQETETQAKLLAYQKDVENYKQVIVQHQESASLRDEENRDEINKLRNEIDQEKRKCRNLRVKVEDGEKKYLDIQSEITHLRSVKDSEIALKDNKIESLKETVNGKEDEIKRIRQEELKRSNMLESALQTYILSAKSAKH